MWFLAYPASRINTTIWCQGSLLRPEPRINTPSCYFRRVAQDVVRKTNSVAETEIRFVLTSVRAAPEAPRRVPATLPRGSAAAAVGHRTFLSLGGRYPPFPKGRNAFVGKMTCVCMYIRMCVP